VNACVHTYTKPKTSSTRSRGLGWRIHGSVEDTKLSTNKQHSLMWKPGTPRLTSKVSALVQKRPTIEAKETYGTSKLTSHTHASRLNESPRVFPFSKWRMSMRRALVRGYSAWGACSEIASSQIQECQQGGRVHRGRMIWCCKAMRTAQGRCREGGSAMEIECRKETFCPTRRQETWNT